MRKKWYRQKINKDLTVYYKLKMKIDQYLICLLEQRRNGNLKMKVARKITHIREVATSIFNVIRKNKVTICTFFDVIEDMLIC